MEKGNAVKTTIKAIGRRSVIVKTSDTVKGQTEIYIDAPQMNGENLRVCVCMEPDQVGALIFGLEMAQEVTQGAIPA